MIRGAGLSFKLASIAYVMTEVAPWLSDQGAAATPEELKASFFNPGGTSPTSVTLYGATARSYTLTGRWSGAADDFFRPLDGALNVPFQHSPEGNVVGKKRISGTVNVGPWTFTQASTGYITFSITLSVVYQYAETIITPPATIAITSSSVADPTVLTTAAHSIAIGDTRVVTIAGHTGSTPSINGTHAFTAVTSTTGTIPVNVTVAGTGGTIQK